MPRKLILIVLILLAAGLLWPRFYGLGIGLGLGLGHLPGDIVIHRHHFHLVLPIATSLLVSAAASFILWLMGR